MLPLEKFATYTSAETPHLTVSEAARVLGVHANTVRAWTDQGRLRCLRINSRGDRRYTRAELRSFLARAAHNETAAAHRRVRPPAGSIVRRLAELSSTADNVDHMLSTLAEILADAGYDRSTLTTDDGAVRKLRGAMPPDEALCRRARRRGVPVFGRMVRRRRSAALPIRLFGVLQLERREDEPLPDGQESDLLATFAAQLGDLIARNRLATDERQHRRRAGILQAITNDIGSQLDLDRILSHLLSYASEYFAADHAGVLRRLPTGYFVFDQAYNISPDFREVIEQSPQLPLTQRAYEQGRVVTAQNHSNDLGGALGEAVVREGINTVTAAPLASGGELLGALVLYHDQPHSWSGEDTALLEQMARMGAVALKNARDYGQMATWAAQLQSIQQLGVRLTRLNTVNEIGHAIAAELNQLIDYHNVRVYRVEGDEVVPVAWRGEVGEYTSEDGTQLRVKVGQGITGWVARHGIAQYLPNAAADHRTETIPGTEDDLDESLLLAPMLYEDEVIGVIVLAKLGLRQFTPDDLRLLEIYASIAAQAIANADVTEQLRAQSEALARQLQSQRELLRVTESILGTLDAQELLDEIAERLDTLLHVDNLAVQLYDLGTHTVEPLFARGVHAAAYMNHAFADDVGLSSHVLRSGEAALVQDVLADERVAFFAGMERQAGALIVAPLRSRDRVLGLLMVNRLGEGASFSAEEFELVKLFAGHVSIALSNAEAHRAVELRAETDPMTGLKNHGSLLSHLAHAVAQRQEFALLMIDMDGFKAYNDAHGHEAGSAFLARLARVIQSACRDSDTVFRYGGDEFAIILPQASESGALRVAESVRHAVRETGTDVGQADITCSVGVAVFPADATDESSLLLAADHACYAAKRSGGDRSATAAEGRLVARELEGAA